MQDLQFHPVTEKLLHLDFLQIFDDKEVTVTIPVHLKGNAIGIRDGGVLSFRRRKIITRAIPGNLPDYIEINIEDLEIGQSIFIKDLRDESYTFLDPDNAVVVGVRVARELIIEEEEDECVDAAAEDDVFFVVGSIPPDFDLFLRFLYYIFLYIGIFAFLGILFLKIINKDIYRLLPPLILPNTGNMGLPICLFAYGKLGLAIAAAVTSVVVVFHFSFNISFNTSLQSI